MVLARIRSLPSWQVTLGVALLGLGFLIAAQLASEAPRVRYTTQERTPLIETATAGRSAAGSGVFSSRRSSGFTITKMAITAANES